MSRYAGSRPTISRIPIESWIEDMNEVTHYRIVRKADDIWRYEVQVKQGGHYRCIGRADTQFGAWWKLRSWKKKQGKQDRVVKEGRLNL